MESFERYPNQVAHPLVHDVYMAYHPGRGTLRVSYLDYSEAQLRMPALPLAHKPRLVAWMARKCGGVAAWRTAYVAELMRYLPVDAFGPCLHSANVSEVLPQCAVPRTAGRQFYVESECIMYHTKFYLALENSESDFYAPEKLYQPLAMGAVPVYIGAPNVADLVPDHAIIQARAFASPQALAAFLLQLAGDEEAYGAYLAWKRAAPWPERFREVQEHSLARAVCNLCDHAYSVLSA